MLELDPVAFTGGAGAQDEVPLARQCRLLGVADRCCCASPHACTLPTPCRASAPSRLHRAAQGCISSSQNCAGTVLTRY